MDYVGKNIDRNDGFEKASGRAKYAGDLSFPKMLHAKVVRIPKAHALIKNINIDKALKIDGIVNIATSDVLNNIAYEDSWPPVIAKNIVRSYADVVALVVAENEKVAIKAASLVEVTYEERDTVFDVEEALGENSPKLYTTGNLYKVQSIKKGEFDRCLEKADIVIERTYSTPFAVHSYLEPETAIGIYEPDGKITIHGSIKSPFDVRRMVAKIMGVNLNMVKVVPATLGGYFGGKDEDMAIMACRAAIMSKITNRPVRISNTREESTLESGKRHRYVMKYKIASNKSGKIVGMDIRILADIGAYTVKSEYVTFRSCHEAAGPYEVPNLNVSVSCLHTNNNNSGSFRGFGSPQVNFACESIIDELAELLTIDPYELRMLNAFEPDSRTHSGQLISNASVKECMENAKSKIAWDDIRKNYKDGPLKLGVGMAASFRGISTGGEAADTASAIISVQGDGSIILSCGILEGGQGAKTVLAQICSETLGVEMSRICVTSWDTSQVPDSGTTAASRGTLMGGNAVKDASELIRNRIINTISDYYNIPKLDLKLEHDQLINTRDNKKLFSFNEAVKICNKKKVNLCAVGHYRAPDTGVNKETGQGDPYFSYVFGSTIALVEVDTMTGKVNLLKFVSSHDVGKAINPILLKGQIYGGVSMGMGTALLEDYYLSGNKPSLLNFDQYYIPTALDIPEVVPVIIENALAEGPFGASSIGEPANQIAAPAIINAIANANGIRIRDLPADLEKVMLGHSLKRKEYRESEACEK